MMVITSPLYLLFTGTVNFGVLIISSKLSLPVKDLVVY